MTPFTTTNHSPASLGQVISCNPNKLGQYPIPEGGNPHPKGADLQNVSTNFHVLQSLTMLASMGSKALGKLNKFKTDINAATPAGAKGECVCHQVLSQTNTSCVQASLVDRDACDAFCNNGCGGTLVWLPNDVFKSATGALKFGSQHLNLLDNLQNFTASPVYTALTNVSSNVADLANTAEIIADMSCFTDLFLEGYHLGGYDEQRPDLHLCVGYYGHGAFAGFSEQGKFDIGGRYSSQNLSGKHRAQMRTGGFAVTALGKTLSVVPGIELNMQLDGYRFFNKCKPLGFSVGGDPAFQCQNGFGIWVGTAGGAISGTVDIDKIDLFHLMDRGRLQSLDSDNNDIVTGGEFIVAGYWPFNYPNNATGPHQWPRALSWDWEGQVASTVSAGLQLAPRIKPIEKILGMYILYPGVTFVPILTLDAGLSWHHEAYKLRSRYLASINKNLAPSQQLDTATFERDMHPMQAPDVSGDTGFGAYVAPGVKAQLYVGLTLSPKLFIGVSAFIGLSARVAPTAHGGLVDLSLPLASALNASNPPEGPCSPTYATTTSRVCSDRSYDHLTPTHSDPNSTYLCSPEGSKGSCCLKVTVNNTPSTVCLGEWLGITKNECNPCGGMKVEDCYAKFKPYLPAGARSVIEGWLQNGTISSINATWNANKTCQQCAEDKTCVPDSWALLPELPLASQCSLHGYCVLASPNSPFLYDVTETACQAEMGTFHPYQCIQETQPVITGWVGPGCHPLDGGFPSACGCLLNTDCAAGETCDPVARRCSSTPADCACDPNAGTSCGAGRACVDGACVRTCGSCGLGNSGYTCTNGTCVSQSGIPYAEQIVWRAKHPPSQGPLHSVETYALTDFELSLFLSAGIHVGAVIKLFKKSHEYTLYQWNDTHDLGSLKKSKYQPGLEATYNNECDPAVGDVTNHQPGTAAPFTCTVGDSYVCRYPSPADTIWSDYDKPDELIAKCKDEMPPNAQNPPAYTPANFGDAMSDLIDFGLGVGDTVWANQAQMCMGDQLLTDWAQNPPEMLGQCLYDGDTPGAPTTFPCPDMDNFTLQIWGCVNANTGLGAQVANFILMHGLDPHVPDYLTTPAYSSSLTSANIIDISALFVDPTQPPSQAVLDPGIVAVATPAEQVMLRNFLLSVDQCYDAHYAAESVCECIAAADCVGGAGQVCTQNQCMTSFGTLATCQFMSFDAKLNPHRCCGDGVVQPGANEDCDDGNAVSGDGCSADCKVEKNPSACCTPTGCIDMPTFDLKLCTAKKGTIFNDKTCSELDNCGHRVQGGCRGSDGECHQPITAAQCASDFDGQFLPDGCPM